MKTEMTQKKYIESKVLAYCLENSMFDNGDKVVLGVSGGADSICLLFLLLKLRERLGIALYVVHVNHGIRADAGADAAYVERLCQEHELPFVLEEVRIEEVAKVLHVGCEEAGRMIRYQAFAKACETYGCNKIAVAHNSNDRAETMLFHLFRGTGLRGMAGMLPVRDNILRPLLCLEREEIEEYLRIKGISYQQDSTNDTDDYARNRIRRNILPYVRENISEGCVRNMCRAAELFAQEEAYLQEQTESALKECTAQEDELGIVFCVSGFLTYHPAIRKRMLHAALKRLSAGGKDIGAMHIEDLMTLFERPGNRQIYLPCRIVAKRCYDEVRLISGQTEETAEEFDEEIPRLYNVGEKHIAVLPDGTKMIFTLLEAPRDKSESGEFYQNISENRYTKWFDYDKIVQWLRVRTRKTGDYLTIHGNGSVQHKKLKDYMVTEKIPKEERDRIPVIAEESHVLWLAGHRISEYYKVTINTKKILQVQWVK